VLTGSQAHKIATLRRKRLNPSMVLGTLNGCKKSGGSAEVLDLLHWQCFFSLCAIISVDQELQRSLEGTTKGQFLPLLKLRIVEPVEVTRKVPFALGQHFVGFL